MKNILTLYRQYFQVSKDVKDNLVLLHLVVFLLFLFVLGFTVSQVIIFLA